MSSNVDLLEVSAKIEADEDVSPAELRAWFQSRSGDPLQGKRGEYNLGVLRKYQVRYLERGSEALSPATNAGRNATADEQRAYNRQLVSAGEIASIIADAEDSQAASERKLRRIFGDADRPAHGHDEKLWLPSHTEYKAQSIGTDPAGGYLVPPINLSGFFQDRLRPASVVLSANPRVVKVPTERVNLPKLGSSVTVANYGEAASIGASDVAIETVGLTMTKFATRTIASSEVLADANPDLRAIIQRDHELSLAAEIDRQLLAGSGVSGQLQGLRNQTGITTTTLGSGNGAVPTLDDIADALYRLEAANAKASAIFCSPRTWNVLRKIQDLQDRYQLAPDPTHDAMRQLFGIPVYTSSQISDTETAGSSGAVCSYIILADLSRVVVGQRDFVNVLYDPFSLSSTDQVVIRSTTRWGIALLMKKPSS